MYVFRSTQKQNDRRPYPLRLPVCGVIILNMTKIRVTERTNRLATTVASSARPGVVVSCISRIRVVSNVSNICAENGRLIKMRKIIQIRKLMITWGEGLSALVRHLSVRKQTSKRD